MGGRSLRTAMTALVGAGALAAGLGAPAVAASAGAEANGPATRVIVQATPGSSVAAAALARRLGGTVTRRLPIIDGFAASVPAGAVTALKHAPGVLAVTSDASGHMMSIDPALGYDTAANTGSLYNIARIMGATDAWKGGWTGKGIDVALIDTGVAPVKGLAGKVVNGPDLSFDSQRPDVRYLDTYGHGTHMASIIAGRDTAGTPASYVNPSAFNGIAPDARIISLKVGASDGSADVSQVIAAIDWVTQHARDPGMNIRVLNLSYGTDGAQDYSVDPLAFAAQAAWRKGVLVVVAGGNDGTSKVDLANPALDGNLLAVGAEDPRGTVSGLDDTIPDFANRGTSKRHVDIVAPGVHVLGLRVPNGVIDQAYPGARVGTRFFLGSGTSQSTAVVSGAAALLFQRYPSLSPQQAKMILGYGAIWFAGGTTTNSGAGLVNVPKALTLAGNSITRALAATTTAKFGVGTGSLDLARGSTRIAVNGSTLAGEKDIFGKTFTSGTWAPKSLAGTAWTADGRWNGSTMTGTGWTTGGDWATSAWTSGWSGLSWTDPSWTGRRWAGDSWDAAAWTGRRWADAAWEGRRWAGSSWS